MIDIFPIFSLIKFFFSKPIDKIVPTLIKKNCLSYDMLTFEMYYSIKIPLMATVRFIPNLLCLTIIPKRYVQHKL